MDLLPDEIVDQLAKLSINDRYEERIFFLLHAQLISNFKCIFILSLDLLSMCLCISDELMLLCRDF